MIESIAPLGLIDDDQIVLDVAALQLSALDHEGEDLAPFETLLRDISERLASARNVAGPQQQAEALAQTIYGQFGFSGDTKTYDAPANADMIDVLTRRRGLPVSLTILYVSAARRQGWTAFALNTPRHVLLRVGTEDTSVLTDPFRSGAVVPGDQLASLILQEDDPFDSGIAAALAPMSNRMTLVRLLLNQASRAEHDGDLGRAQAMMERIVTIAPESSHGWWHYARLQLVAGDSRGARHSLISMQEVTLDRTRRQHIAHLLERLST
jgi:regulator of sirC expression with transglutaminase-like and TPR domain